MIEVYDNGEIFGIKGSNTMLARFCSPDLWARLGTEWKLDMLMLGCEAMELYFRNPPLPPTMSPRISKAAPLYIKCQQKSIQLIREGIPGHGTQRLIWIDQHRIRLECGCEFPITWLPVWEQKSILEFQKFIQGK